MKTVINRRFLIGLIIGALLFGAALQGLHAVQINRQSQFFLKEAHRAQKNEQFEVAVNRFQQYMKLAPKDYDAEAEFGLLLAQHRATRDAAPLLENVLRAKPDRDDLRRPLVAIEMGIGRWNDAKTHLERLLASSPGDAALWKLLGTCQAARGEFGPAVASLQKSIRTDPHEVDAYEHLAEVLRRVERPAEADAWMNKLVQANPQNARAHVLDGQYLVEIGREEEASAQADKALELAPTDANALLLAARLSSRKAPYSKAQNFAQRAIESVPANAVGYITLARIDILAGDRKKAIACLETGAEMTRSRDAVLLWELGRLRIDSGDVAGTEEVVNTLQKLPADDRIAPLIGHLESQLELTKGHWQAAVERLEQVAPQLKNSPDILKQICYQTAGCHEKLGNTELQLAAYRDAARVDPAWPPAQLGIADALLALGKFDEALEQYQRIAKLDGMAAAGAVGEVRLLILKNLTRAPAEQDWTAVDRLLDQLSHSNPDAVGVIVLRAEALAGRQRPADAEKELLAARTKFPDRIELWSALVGLADREQQWPRAEQLLAEADKKFGDQVWLRLARGSFLLSRYKQESAAKLQALDTENKAFGPDDRLKLDRGLATLSLEAGAASQATGFARRICDADPKNLEARLFLFDLALGNGDSASLKQVVQEIRNLEGEGPFWHYGQAALCLLTKPATAALEAEATQHIAAARRLRPGWSALSLLTAQIQDRQGKSGSALQSYLESIGLGEPSPAAVRRAVELLYAGQRYVEADQLLRRLEQQPTLFSGEVERLASKVSARMDNLDRALELARKVAADSGDWQDQVWLGQLQSLMGFRAKSAGRAADAESRFVEAEKSFRRAVALKPDAQEPWVALIRFFALIDRKADAAIAVRTAADKFADRTGALALAACYEAIGNVDETSKQYQIALSQRPHDPVVVRLAAEFEIRSGKLVDAESHLRTIVAGRLTAPASEVASARRALAGVLLASGKYPNLLQALELIEQNLADGTTAADLREKALILAVSPQLQRRREAIEILEKLLPTQTDAEDLNVTLAQLYLAEKDWPRAAEILRSLATSHEQDSRFTAAYAVRLLEHQEIDEAELWIRRLEEIAPNEFTTASLKAEALVKRGQVDSAIQALRDSMARQKLTSAEAAAQTKLSAARLEELARGMPGPDHSASAAKLLTEAERLYRDYVKQRPDEQIVLATFLGRRGRFDEAATFVESAPPTADPKAMAEAYVELWEDGAVATSAGGRLEKSLVASIARNEDSAELRIALAELRTRQKRATTAAAIYREVLGKDASNIVAMNNLAILLAAEKQHDDEAERLIGQAIAAAGPLPALLDTRATIYLALGTPQKALTDLEQAISSEPRPNRQFRRALACLQLGQLQTAAQALSEARKLGFDPEKLDPLEKSAYQNLALELQRRGG